NTPGRTILKTLPTDLSSPHPDWASSFGKSAPVSSPEIRFLRRQMMNFSILSTQPPDTSIGWEVRKKIKRLELRCEGICRLLRFDRITHRAQVRCLRTASTSAASRRVPETKWLRACRRHLDSMTARKY